MRMKAALVGMCSVLVAISAGAQTAVTTTSGGTANTVPLYTGSANIENSVITQVWNGIDVGGQVVANPLIGVNQGNFWNT